MKSMDALLIIKKELYKDTLPTVEAQNALDCLEEYITAPRVKVTSEALANIRKNTLNEFVEWYKERLEHIQEHEKELLDDDVKHEYSYLVEYRKGTTDMIDRLIYWLDNNLNRFLEERK